MEENYGHKPVLLHECLGVLAIKPDGIYVDGTLGGGGHVKAAGCQVEGTADEVRRILLDAVKEEWGKA